MNESTRPVTNESTNDLVAHDPARKHIAGEENQAVVRRRGNRRAAGQDTPAGTQTDRTVIPAKREQAQREAGSDKPS